MKIINVALLAFLAAVGPTCSGSPSSTVFDGAVLPDAGVPADAFTDGGDTDKTTDSFVTAAGAACVGTPCSSAPCCAGATCIDDVFNGIFCAATCTAPGQCNSRCCAALVDTTARVCAPVDYCALVTPAPETCGRLILVANDKRLLGVATADPVAVDGVCNPTSKYGSKVSETSIFNESTIYGSKTSSLSAYYESAKFPPSLACEKPGGLLNVKAVVSKNRSLPPDVMVIDPDELCKTLTDSLL